MIYTLIFCNYNWKLSAWQEIAMMHQDLTTWFSSQAQVDDPCIEGCPYLDDLPKFGWDHLNNPWTVGEH